MVTNTVILDENNLNAPRYKHVGLTGYLKRNWRRNPNELKRIVYSCDVSPYLGQLPPELRAIAPGGDIAGVTQQFRKIIEDFALENIQELRDANQDKIWPMNKIEQLFGTKCVMFSRGVNVYGVNPWAGLLGFVCKLSFPEINAHYALKLYYDNVYVRTSYCHGPWAEVATALAANHAEPKDNVQMYMASLKYEPYLLSKWAGDTEDGVSQRQNKNRIFVTRDEEDESRNRRGGRRIDWGETSRSKYGEMPYPARKLYRQIMNLDKNAVQKSLGQFKNCLERKDAQNAIKLAKQVALSNFDGRVVNFIHNMKQY